MDIIWYNKSDKEFLIVSSEEHSQSQDQKKSSNAIRRTSFILAIIIIAIAATSLLSPAKNLEEIPISDVIAEANTPDGNIKKITLMGSNLEITLKDNDQPTQKSRKDPSGTLFDQGLVDHCSELENDELKACQEKYPTIEYKDPVDVAAIILDLATIVVPIILIIAFFTYMIRQAQNMNNQSIGFGKAKADKIMAEIGIAEDRRLKGLGENQVAKLIEALD